jgi:hypothetical protein
MIYVCIILYNISPWQASSLHRNRDGLLRHLWTGDKSIGLYDVSTLKSPAVIGTVTVVMTTDDFLLGHARSAQVYQVSGVPRPGEKDHRTRMHFLGKGMFPTDCDPSGIPDPCMTVKQALRNELGLEDKEIEETQVIPTAFVFDTKRWQPVFCYIAQIPFSFKELKSRHLAAEGGWEAEDFVPFRFDSDDQKLRQLLLNEQDKWCLSSNHASMALYAMLVWRHGLVEVSRVLGKSNTSMKKRGVA